VLGENVNKKPGRLTVEECRCLDIANLVTSGLFRYPSPQSWTFFSRGLEIAVTCPTPTTIVDEWIWTGVTHVKAPVIGSRLRLSYTLGGPESEVEQELGIAAIPSPLGRGKWYYFRCPGLNEVGCARRVGKLYLPPNEDRFACRNCYDLTYRSCKEHNKRLDEFRRMSLEDLTRVLQSTDWNTRFLALRAAMRMRGTWSKR
jgi:hypothetical protein